MPFPIWNQSVVPRPVLTIAFWPVYRYLRGQVVWYSCLLKNFPQLVVIHTVKGFGIVNKAEIDVFLETSCFFHDPVDVGNLFSGFSAFSKTSLNIRKFMVHILLKPSLENFKHYFTSVWNKCNCAVVWAFFGIAFLWDWNENWPFPVLCLLLSFPNLLAYWVQHFLTTSSLRILGNSFLWDWKENWPFPVLWPWLSFPNLLAYWMQHFHSIIF